MAIRIVFMGSPEFAIPSLRILAENYPVVGVVTQPDRPAGRGRELSSPPVKLLAQELGLAVMQPERLRQTEAIEQLQAWKPNVIIVAAFGQILRSAVLELPQYGCVNVHASLLPRWRGAAPIQAALLHGDRETGVTIMKMDPGVDTGPLLTQKSTPILEEDDAETLSHRLANLGAELLLETLPMYLEGAIALQEQDEKLATYTPMLKKEDGKLDLNLPAEELQRRVRAFTPWPGAFITWQGQPFKILRARVIPSLGAKAGQRLVLNGMPALSTGEGLLVLERVQPAGRKAMRGSEFMAGARKWEN